MRSSHSCNLLCCLLESPRMRFYFSLLFLQLWVNIDVSLSQTVCPQPPDVPHGSVSETTRRDEYQDKHVIQITCETGYTSGLPIRYMCSNGKWMELRRGECKLRPCGLPEDTPNGYYEIIHGEGFFFGTVVQYSCNRGYQMVSKVSNRTCLGRSWTHHVPVCQPVKCDPPPEVEGVIVRGLPANGESILADRYITFSCEDPEKHLNGSSVVTCGKDGQWDEPFPTCLARCTVTSVHSSVRLASPQVEGTLVESGGTLSFSCRQSNVVLRGKEVVECLANGKWSDPFPTCGAASGCQGPPPRLEYGDIKYTAKLSYDLNEKVEYVCQKFYLMSGQPHLTCKNGQWLGEMICLKPCTVNRATMNEHNVTFMHREDDKLYSEHNDVIEFACLPGTHPPTKNRMRYKCNNGDIHVPTCQ